MAISAYLPGGMARVIIREKVIICKTLAST